MVEKLFNVGLRCHEIGELWSVLGYIGLCLVGFIIGFILSKKGDKKK